MFKSARGFILSAVLASPLAAAPPAGVILARTDAIRIPRGDFFVSVMVTSIKSDGRRSESTYEVLARGAKKTIIKTLSPKADRGRTILYSDEDLWVFLPSVSKPLRISTQQRLMGEVSNGDLARLSFVDDYTPSLEREEAAAYVLSLAAKRKSATYRTVRLWVDKKTFRPLRAEFFAVSGRLLKTGVYENFQRMAGDVRPLRLVLTDALAKSQKSIIDYKKITIDQRWPEKYFTKDYLKKLKY